MSTFSRLFGAMAALSLTAGVLADPYLGKLKGYVTAPGAVDAQIQKILYTPEIRTLTDTLSENLAKNAEWFNEYSKSLAPGQRIPYHPNMGLTESQYQQLLGGEDQKRLTPSGGTRLAFSWREDDVLKITGLPDEPPFDSLLYESVSDTLITSFGNLSRSIEAKGQLGDDTSLAWRGRLWSTERKDDKGKVSILYVIGDLTDSNRGVLIHEIKGVVNDEIVEHHYMIMWNK